MEFLLERTSLYGDSSTIEDLEVNISKYSLIRRETRNGEFKIFIVLDSLKELFEFQKDYGEIIITETFFNGSIVPTIEIYDDFRE